MCPYPHFLTYPAIDGPEPHRWQGQTGPFPVIKKFCKKGLDRRDALRIIRASAGGNASGHARQSGRSSGVEHNLAKVGVEGSNPFARSKANFQKPRTTAAFRISGLDRFTHVQTAAPPRQE